MMSRALVILVACLVVGSHAEKLQQKNLRSSSVTTNARKLTNGKEMDVPDPHTKHRRLLRHYTLPVGPIYSPISANATPVLPPDPEPSRAPLSSSSSVPSPSLRNAPSSVPTMVLAGAPTSTAPSRRPTSAPSPPPSDSPALFVPAFTEMPTTAAPSRRRSSAPSPSPSSSPSSDPNALPTGAPTSRPPSERPTSVELRSPSNSPSAVPPAFSTRLPTTATSTERPAPSPINSPSDVPATVTTEAPATQEPSEISPATIVQLSNFTIVVTSDGVTVDQSQLTTTIEEYMTAGMMQVYPNARTVLLAIPRQLDKGTSVRYTGIVVISSSTPPSTTEVRALEEELLLDLSAVQAAVDANSAIGLNVRVEQVVAFTKSVVALYDFTMVLTADASNSVDIFQLTKTLEDYPSPIMLHFLINAEAVVLDGIPRRLEDSIAVDYSAYVVFSDATPPTFQQVQDFSEVLLLNLNDLQAVVDSNPAIGQNVRIEQVIVENNSVVALSAFTTFLTSDDAGALDEAELVVTLNDVLMARMLDFYASAGYVTLAGIPRQLEGSTSVDFSGFVAFTDATPPAFREVQMLEEVLLLNLSGVQTAVDGNSAIGENVRVEQVVSGNNSAVALSGFTTILTSDDTDAPDEAELTMALKVYLTAGMMEDYPNAGTVTLAGIPRELEGSTAVDYSGYVVFIDATPPAFVDVHAVEEDLMLDLNAVQVAVDGNPAVGQDVRVEAVAAENNSVVALSGFTTILTSDDMDAVDEAQLTATLEDYLAAGMTQVYSSVGTVTLDGIQSQVDRGDSVDYTGYVLFNNAVPPPFLSIQDLGKILLLDASALQSAVDGNPAIGKNPLVAEVNFDGFILPTGSFVGLSGFTVVVTSDDDTNTVDEAQLTKTLEDYLMTAMTQVYRNAGAITLVGSQRQIDQGNGVDYNGFIIFTDKAPSLAYVQDRLSEALIFKLPSVQAAVDGNAAIGQNVRVEQVIVDDKSVVALTMFNFIVTGDDTNAVDEGELTKMLEIFLNSGMMQPSARVSLDGIQRELEGSSSVVYTGHAIFADETAPLRTFQKVQTLYQELLFNITAVQAAVDGIPAIGENVRVEEVVAGDKSVVALSGFSMVVTPDADDPVDIDQLTETVADYLLAGLMQDYPDSEAVILQSQQLQPSDIIAFSGYAVFPNTVPGFRDVQVLERRLMRNTSAVQTAVDSNRAIGQNVRVVGITFDDPEDNDDDDDDNNTAAIFGVVVGCSAFLLALIALVITHRRRNEPTLPPPLPTEVKSVDRNEIPPVIVLAPPEENQIPPPTEAMSVDGNAISPAVALVPPADNQMPPPPEVESVDGNVISPAVTSAPPEDNPIPPPTEVKSVDGNAISPVVTLAPPEENPMPPPTEVKSVDGNAIFPVVTLAPPEENLIPPPTEVKSVDGNAISPVVALTPPEENPMPPPTEVESDDGNANSPAVAPVLSGGNRMLATAAGQHDNTAVIFLGEVDETE